MLDRLKLYKQLEFLADQLFPDITDEIKLAEKIWQKICSDQNFLEKVKNSKTDLLLPTWDGNLSDTYQINSNLKNYQLLAVDGSQVYPDRNFSVAGCFLINTGGIFFDYKPDVSRVDFLNEPKVFLLQDFEDISNKIQFGHDLVDLVREEYEFKALAQKAEELFDESKISLAFVDGTLIFWPLESKSDFVKKYFLNIYIKSLSKFYEQNKLIAGYISFSKSRELVSLLKLGICDKKIANCFACKSVKDKPSCNVFDTLIDSIIAKFFLKPFSRTTIFYNHSKITEFYPEELKPAFFYLNVGCEIVRIEIPNYIAKDLDKIDLICRIALDQVEKGNGYPVSLAHAHEQAVVKNSDREYFYTVLSSIAIEKNRKLQRSQKSLKKMGMWV